MELAAPARPAAGLPAAELAACLAPQRAGDPLGLGLAPGERPAAPPDPDEYDRGREDTEYARSLLTDDERRLLDADIEHEGYLTIAQVRAIVAENTAKGSVESAGLDPEVMALLDARINYKIFVAGDNIYTREDLYDHYPFHEFGVQPEAVFAQQELGVFEPRKHAMTPGELEYVARDVGDETVEFVMVEDLVGRAARKDYKPWRTPLRVVKTKIYVGKERWEDFALLQRFFRGAARVAAAQVGPGGAVAGMLGCWAGAGPRTGALLLTDGAELARREAELAQREDAHRAATDAHRAATEAHRAATEAAQSKLDADIKKCEAMLAAIAGAAAP